MSSVEFFVNFLPLLNSESFFFSEAAVDKPQTID